MKLLLYNASEMGRNDRVYSRCRTFRVSPAILLLLCLSINWTGVYADNNNSTSNEDINKVVCIYPVSGQYGLLQRLNYYFLIICVIFSQNVIWLVAGATAAIMLSSSIVAVHAILLACFSAVKSHRAAFDLDIWASWSILSITSILLEPMLEYTVAYRSSDARPLIKVWGVLVVIGTICSFASLNRTYSYEWPCVSQIDNTTVFSPSDIPQSNSYNCTPSCFGSYQLFRQPSEILILPKQRVLGDAYSIYYNLGIIILITTVVGLIACLHETNPLSPSEEATRRVGVELVRRLRAHQDLDAFMNAPESRSPYLRYRYPYTRYIGAGTEKWSEYFRSLLLFASPLLFILTIIINESFLLKSPSLPTGEGPIAIGQWSCWVGTAMALIAAAMNKYVGSKPLRRPPSPTLFTEEELRRWRGDPVIETTSRGEENDETHLMAQDESDGSRPMTEDGPILDEHQPGQDSLGQGGSESQTNEQEEVDKNSSEVKRPVRQNSVPLSPVCALPSHNLRRISSFS